MRIFLHLFNFHFEYVSKPLRRHPISIKQIGSFREYRNDDVILLKKLKVAYFVSY